MRIGNNNNSVCVSAACIMFFIRLPQPQEPKESKYICSTFLARNTIYCAERFLLSLLPLFSSDFKMLFRRAFQSATYHHSSKHLACKTRGILFNAAVGGVGGDQW